MSFLFPSFLFGLASVAIPILIHLFNFRRTRQVYFTNVEFLRTVQTSSSSFRRLKHLLILLARVLFLVFLVLAFAQPFIPARNRNAASSSATSVYIDNSLSMQNESENQSHLDAAVTQASSLTEAIGSNRSFHLLTNDFDNAEQYLMNGSKLRDRLTELKFSNTFRSIESVYRRQLSLLEKENSSAGKQLVWLSDFQKSTSGDLSKLKLDSLSQILLVPIRSSEIRNVYVDSLWLTTPFVRQMEANQLTIRLRNAGRERVENLSVQLFLDDRQASTATITLEPGAAGEAVFGFTVSSQGFKKGRISFDEEPVAFDNTHYFVLNAAPVVNIVHLYGSQTGNFIQNVFGNSSAFSSRSFAANSVDPAVINNSDLVMLEGIETISLSLQNALQQFVSRGGSVALFPAAEFNVDAYAAWLSRLGVRAVVKTSTSPTAPAPSLAPPDIRQPFFSGIFENSIQRTRMGMPTARPVWQWANAGSPLLSYSNGQPFLSQFGAGRGKMYVCASPLQSSYSSFARHALFVPVLYQMATLSKGQERMAYTFGEPVVDIEVKSSKKEDVFRLRKDNFEIIPVQRLAGGRLIFELPQPAQVSGNQTPEAGYYELVSNEKSGRLLAFNYDKKESQMDFYTPDELKQIFSGRKNVQVLKAGDEGSAARDFAEQNIGTSLWKYCLILALTFALAEILLIRFWK